MILFGLFEVILHNFTRLLSYRNSTLVSMPGFFNYLFGLAKHAIVTNFLIKLCILIVYMHLLMYYRGMANSFSSKFNSLLTNGRCAIWLSLHDEFVAPSLKSRDLSEVINSWETLFSFSFPV